MSLSLKLTFHLESLCKSFNNYDITYVTAKYYQKRRGKFERKIFVINSKYFHLFHCYAIRRTRALLSIRHNRRPENNYTYLMGSSYSILIRTFQL